MCPALDGVEEGLLHPVFCAGELFGAHSDKPQGAGRILPYQDSICAQCFQRQGSNLHAGVYGHIQGNGTGVRFEGAVANFEAEPTGEFPGGSQTLSQLEAQLPNSSANLPSIGRIRLKGVLAAHAFLFALGNHGALVNAARHGPKVLALSGAEAFFEPVQAHGPHLGDGVNTVSGELLGTFRAHTPQVGDFSRVKKFLNPLGWNDPQPVRFATGRRHFGE